jgi:16S rRNA (uracil1498-N3)-methyltransferase
MKNPPTKLYAAGKSIRGDTIILSGSEFHHLVRVLRLEPVVEKRQAHFIIEERRDGDDLELARELILAQGLVRRDEFSEILAGCTQVGVTEFIPFRAERSIAKSNSAKGESIPDRWNQILISAIKQSGRAYLPRIASPVDLDGLMERSEQYDLRLVAYERTVVPLREVWPGTGTGAVLLTVGPEAGFNDTEIETLTAAGFKPFSLGRRRLRSRTAAVVAAGILADLIGSRGGDPK